MRDSIGRLQGRPIDCDAIKRAAWQDDGILVVDVDGVGLSWPDREILGRIGDGLYGRRKTAC